MNTTYIYGLKDPRTKEIRYVGKSDNPEKRLQRHLKNAITPKTHCYCWINSLLKLDLLPELVILEEVSVEEWGVKEDYWINQYLNLTNQLDGGKFCPMLIPEIVEKYKKTLKENPRAFSVETREKLSAHAKSLWDKGILKKGRLNSEKTKELMSIVAKKVYAGKSDEVKAKFLLASNLANSKAIVQLSLESMFIAEYSTVSEAEVKFYGHAKGKLSKACKTKNKTKGFLWMYKKDWILEASDPELVLPINN
jgi:hypothetical protein